MKDYSQTGELKHILNALGVTAESKYSKPPMLLDIGAWDAETFSNSRALLEIGWSGMLIEPSPGPLKKLCQFYADRPDVMIVGAAISVEPAIISIRVTDDAVSQPEGERIKTWETTGGFYGTMWTNALPLSQLFAQVGGDFQFVNFDVEGTSVDLFAEMCRIGPRPRCVCVEHDARYVELAQIAEAANYIQVHLNGNNAVLQWIGSRFTEGDGI